MFNNFFYSLLVFFLFFNFCSAQIPNNNLFYSEINLNIKKNIALDKASLASIIYGNSKYGYFETNDFIFQDGQLKASLIPPGYQANLEVYLKDRQNICQKIFTCRPKNKFVITPLNIEPSRMKKWKNRLPFSTPFIILSGYTMATKYRSNQKIQSCVYILNRYGELLWLYIPKYPVIAEYSQIIARQLYDGKYALLIHLNDIHKNLKGYFEIIDLKNGLLKQFNPDEKFPEYIFHHDFTPIDYFSEKFFVISYEDRYINNRLRRVNKLCLLDMTKESLTVIWKGPPKDKFRNNKKNYFNFNSINYYPGQGLLISLHNPGEAGRLILLDDKFQTRWTLGAKDTTYLPKTTKDIFYGQHDVHLLKNGHILLFNNGKQHQNNSGIIEIEIDPVKKTYSIIKKFNLDYPIFSKWHSSANKLNNGNILGFFAGTNNHAALVEFDYETGKIVARMNSDVGGEYRAVPLDNIGTEKFLGYTLPYRIIR